MIGSPVVARRQLGAALRRLREAAGVSVDQAAEELECSASKVSRLETGHGVPRSRDVRDLIRFYGVQERQRAELLELVEEGQQQSWHDDFKDIPNQDSTYPRFIGLEAGASEILNYSGPWVPALLQTEDYALAVTRASSPERPESEVRRLVELRLGRQEVLRREPKPPRFETIIDEAAILRPAGGSAVMRQQLETLLETVQSSQKNLHVRLLPLSRGMHGLATGHLSILKFAADEQLDLVFAEGHTGSGFREQPEDVRRYEDLFRSAAGLTVEGPDFAKRLAGLLGSKAREPSGSQR